MAAEGRQDVVFAFDKQITERYGYVDTYEKAKYISRQYEDSRNIQFVQGRGLNLRRFGQSTLQDAMKKGSKIFWQDSDNYSLKKDARPDKVAKPFDGLPYINCGKANWECIFGNKCTKTKAFIKSKGGIVSKKNTNKVGCPARVYMQEHLVFPDFNVLKRDNPKTRQKMSRLFRHSLPLGNVRFERRIYVELPADSRHERHTLCDGSTLPLHTEVIKEIKRLYVEHGIENARQMHPFLNRFVEQTLCKDFPLPARTNRRYFPTVNIIRRHIYSSKLDRAKRTLDTQRKPLPAWTDCSEESYEASSTIANDVDLLSTLVSAAQVTDAGQHGKKQNLRLRDLDPNVPYIEFGPQKQPGLNIYPRIFAGVPTWKQTNMTNQQINRTREKAKSCRSMLAEIMDLTYLIKNEHVFNSLASDLKIVHQNMEQYVDDLLIRTVRKARADAVEKIKKTKQGPTKQELIESSTGLHQNVTVEANVVEQVHDPVSTPIDDEGAEEEFSEVGSVAVQTTNTGSHNEAVNITSTQGLPEEERSDDISFFGYTQSLKYTGESSRITENQSADTTEPTNRFKLIESCGRLSYIKFQGKTYLVPSTKNTSCLHMQCKNNIYTPSPNQPTYFNPYTGLCGKVATSKVKSKHKLCREKSKPFMRQQGIPAIGSMRSQSVAGSSNMADCTIESSEVSPTIVDSSPIQFKVVRHPSQIKSHPVGKPSDASPSGKSTTPQNIIKVRPGESLLCRKGELVEPVKKSEPKRQQPYIITIPRVKSEHRDTGIGACVTIDGTTDPGISKTPARKSTQCVRKPRMVKFPELTKDMFFPVKRSNGNVVLVPTTYHKRKVQSTEVLNAPAKKPTTLNSPLESPPKSPLSDVETGGDASDKTNQTVLCDAGGDHTYSSMHALSGSIQETELSPKTSHAIPCGSQTKTPQAATEQIPSTQDSDKCTIDGNKAGSSSQVGQSNLCGKSRNVKPCLPHSHDEIKLKTVTDIGKKRRAVPVGIEPPPKFRRTRNTSGKIPSSNIPTLHLP